VEEQAAQRHVQQTREGTRDGTNTCVHTQASSHVNMHTRMKRCTQIHTNTHTHIHACTQTHTHSHTRKGERRAAQTHAHKFKSAMKYHMHLLFTYTSIQGHKHTHSLTDTCRPLKNEQTKLANPARGPPTTATRMVKGCNSRVVQLNTLPRKRCGA
jgi:hypothetical protein